MISAMGQGFMPSVYSGTMDSGSRVRVPVSSSQSVYAQFKYVSGVPASMQDNPLSISRVQILDNLISFLNVSPEAAGNGEAGEEMDRVIMDFSRKMHNDVKEKPITFNSFQGGGVDLGILFNLQV